MNINDPASRLCSIQSMLKLQLELSEFTLDKTLESLKGRMKQDFERIYDSIGNYFQMVETARSQQFPQSTMRDHFKNDLFDKMKLMLEVQQKFIHHFSVISELYKNFLSNFNLESKYPLFDYVHANYDSIIQANLFERLKEVKSFSFFYDLNKGNIMRKLNIEAKISDFDRSSILLTNFDNQNSISDLKIVCGKSTSSSESFFTSLFKASYKFPALKKLSLANSGYVELSNFSLNIPNLEVLKLKNSLLRTNLTFKFNKLQELSVINCGLTNISCANLISKLTSLNNLELLDLSNNKISILACADSTSGVTRRSELNYSIQEIKIKYLNLSHNKFTCFPTDSSMNKRNNIEKLFPRLTVIDLSRNNLNTMPSIITKKEILVILANNPFLNMSYFQKEHYFNYLVKTQLPKYFDVEAENPITREKRSLLRHLNLSNMSIFERQLKTVNHSDISFKVDFIYASQANIEEQNQVLVLPNGCERIKGSYSAELIGQPFIIECSTTSERLNNQSCMTIISQLRDFLKLNKSTSISKASFDGFVMSSYMQVKIEINSYEINQEPLIMENHLHINIETLVFLQELNLSGNGLSANSVMSIFKLNNHLYNLKSLNLSKNQIKNDIWKLGPFNLHKLKWLNLSSNLISSSHNLWSNIIDFVGKIKRVANPIIRESNIGQNILEKRESDYSFKVSLNMNPIEASLIQMLMHTRTPKFESKNKSFDSSTSRDTNGILEEDHKALDASVIKSSEFDNSYFSTYNLLLQNLIEIEFENFHLIQLGDTFSQ